MEICNDFCRHKSVLNFFPDINFMISSSMHGYIDGKCEQWKEFPNFHTKENNRRLPGSLAIM